MRGRVSYSLYLFVEYMTFANIIHTLWVSQFVHTTTTQPHSKRIWTGQACRLGSGCGQFYWVWLVKYGCEMCSCMCMSTKQLVVNAHERSILTKYWSAHGLTGLTACYGPATKGHVLHKQLLHYSIGSRILSLYILLILCIMYQRVLSHSQCSYG